MSNDALIQVMTGAVVVSAVALLLQMMILFGMFRAVKAMREQVNDLLPKVEAFLPKAHSLVASAEKTLDESQRKIAEITTKANNVLDITQKQLTRVDELVGDATTRARNQMDRVELVLDDSVNRVHRTVVELNNGILRPIREINGVAMGLRAAFHQLIRGGRPNNVDRVTADEEMFI